LSTLAEQKPAVVGPLTTLARLVRTLPIVKMNDTHRHPSKGKDDF